MLSAALSMSRLADLPDRPEEYRGQDRRGEAVEAVLAEIHHVAHAKNVGERRVGNAFASVAEDRAQQSTHQPALIEPDVDHGCRTDGRHTKCNEPENVHALRPGDR